MTPLHRQLPVTGSLLRALSGCKARSSTSALSASLLLHWHRVHRNLHSFPTRRSSDLDTDKLAHVVVATDALANWDPNTVLDRKSTRLNSSHLGISYAVFCLKKKKRALSCCKSTSSTSALSARSMQPSQPLYVSGPTPA